MYKKNELRRKIDDIINQSSDMNDEQKFIWSEVFRNLADYQEELLDVSESEQTGVNPDFSWNIVCGITDSNTLPNGFEFVSCTDDFKSVLKNHRSEDDFPDITSENTYNNKIKVLNTGYIDVPYEKLSDYCGRENKYKGILSDGKTEFSYSLILQNSLLNQEKILYSLSTLYGIKAPVIYAPYFRRMVYVETDCGETDGCDLQLEKNNLDDKLKLGFRSIWNVSISNNPAAVKRGDSFYYTLKKNTFIIAEEKYENKLDIEISENENSREVRVVPHDSEMNPKNYMIKAEISCVSDYISGSATKGFQCVNEGNYLEKINRIYSRSDVHKVLNGFKNVVNFIDVDTKCSDDMIVCSYEKHFEYPFISFFEKTGRPKLFLKFEKDKSDFLCDRIVYTVHQIQRLFPEYLWKGGYIK